MVIETGSIQVLFSVLEPKRLALAFGLHEQYSLLTTLRTPTVFRRWTQEEKHRELATLLLVEVVSRALQNHSISEIRDWWDSNQFGVIDTPDDRKKVWQAIYEWTEA